MKKTKAELNEIAAAARDAKRAADEAHAPDPATTGHWPLLPIGIGIGSAALAAALLYTRSGRGKDGKGARKR